MEHDVSKGRFNQKSAIVTGATHGIGLATATELCREGARVLVSGLPKDGHESIQSLQAEGYDVDSILGDMSDESFCGELVQGALERWGRVDFLVNNAFSFFNGGLESTREDWHHTFNVGLFAFVKMIQEVARPMAETGGGAIVNVSSISAVVAQPTRWTYNTGKGAVAQLTRCAALDLGDRKIRVNSVSPGWTWTREVDKAAGGDREKWEPVWGDYGMLQRCAEPVEIARPILFLLSEDASFITGTDLPVDAGYQSMGPEGPGRTSNFAGTK